MCINLLNAFIFVSVIINKMYGFSTKVIIKLQLDDKLITFEMLNT